MPIRPEEVVLDKYRVIRLIGEGGMARVWLAEEPAFAGRLVALKEIKRADLTPSLLEEQEARFSQEIAIARLLAEHHVPHVVHALTVERLAEGGSLLVMEYMPGGSLAERIAANPQGMPLEEIVAVALALCQALAGFHALPVLPVHRDIKPSNVLFDSQGQAYLADFGLAQLPGMSGRSRLQGGPHPGTPLYMAPEQASSPEPLTPAADFFALGCVLFEMGVGQPYKRVKPGTPPSAINRALPRWFDAVVAQALAEDPWQRWQDAGALQRALQERREPEPASTGPEPTAALADRAGQGQAAPSRPSWWRRLLGIAEPAPGTSAGAAVRSATPAPPRGAPPFRFRNGQEVHTLEELVRLSAADPAAALWHLDGGQFAPWLAAMGYQELANLAAKLEQEGNGPAKLKRFLDATGVSHDYRMQMLRDFDWVTIPAGPFLMGSNPERDGAAKDDERPQHRVILAEFAISRVPVTNAQYRAFVVATNRAAPSHWPGGNIPAGKEDHPVVNVTWDDAQAFCRFMGVRLPTEAEWEKAARGIDGRIYPWGYEPPDAKRCNFGNIVGGTTPVGKYPAGASPYGVLDMAGNVWEWTSSLYKPYPYKADDGRERLQATGGEGGRVLRGGSFNSDARYVRCACRDRLIPVSRVDFIGFRVVSPGL